jgi:type II secretory pathway predicted ATPase ExeA
LSSLYLEHFRLTEAPFGITPNGKFFFEGQARGAILDALQHAVLDEDGIVVVVGEVGSGKTMLCRMLADRLPREQVDLVYLANPSFGPREILQSLIADWGLQPPAEGQPLVLTIQQALLERHAQGRRAVVLIDEAQAMPPESLEEIKLLSNLETAQHKLLQIVLFGQPELDDLLALPKLRQVRDRVVHRFELQPLNGPDAAAYIEHRLRRAGWQGGALFEPRALKQLTSASGGRIRALHLLADKALLAAFAQGAHQVDQGHVRLALAEFQNTGAGAKRSNFMSVTPHRVSPWLALGALAALGLGVGGAVGYGLGQRTAPTAEPGVTNAIVMPKPMPADAPAPARTAAALPATTPHVNPAPISSDLQRRYATVNPALRETLLRTRAVFDEPAQDFWVVQVGLADSEAGALRLVQQITQAGVEVWLQDRVYVDKSSGIAMNAWAVYAGRYTDRASAMQNLQKWPASLKTYKPLPRSLVRLRTEAYPERVPS